MGQYFMLVNKDKKEFVNPHTMGCGLKFMEMCCMGASMGPALLYLVVQSTGEGNGDGLIGGTLRGHWAGDRIVLVGDYDDSQLYREAFDNSVELRQEMIILFDEELPPRWDR